MAELRFVEAISDNAKHPNLGFCGLGSQGTSGVGFLASECIETSIAVRVRSGVVSGLSASLGSAECEGSDIAPVVRRVVGEFG